MRQQKETTFENKAHKHHEQIHQKVCFFSNEKKRGRGKSYWEIWEVQKK